MSVALRATQPTVPWIHDCNFIPSRGIVGTPMASPTSWVVERTAPAAEDEQEEDAHDQRSRPEERARSADAAQ